MFDISDRQPSFLKVDKRKIVERHKAASDMLEEERKSAAPLEAYDDSEDGKGSDEEFGYGYYVDPNEEGKNDTEPYYQTSNIRGEEVY